MSAEDHKCPRCGQQLKTVIVRIPSLGPMPIAWTDEIPNSNPIAYDEKEEIADCPRCTGSY